MRINSLKNAKWALPATLALLLLPAVASARSAPVGLTLDKGKQTIQSAQRVDLTRDFATLPLHRGTAGGETVWFVITDS